jgi:arylsulfatase A-like enzyme
MPLQYLKHLATGLCIACTCSLAVADTTTKPQPNIILILVDDMGYADVSCYSNDKHVKTPNIDKIADAGMKFTSGYVSGLQCAPTRAGLLSGKYQQRFGFYHNRDVFNKVFLPQVTMPQVLKKSGYRTGMIGKWHLGRSQEAEYPHRRGFDEFYGFLYGMRGYLAPAKGGRLMRNNEPVKEHFGYLTDFLNREAVSFVNKHSGKTPFFLYVAYNAPHYPLEAKEEYLKQYNTGNPDRDKQLAMMASVDEGVGLILDALKKNGQYDNTMVIFLNDNGGEPKRGASNGKLREGKNSLYEGGPRVPFAVSWPAKIKAKQISSIPVTSLDLFATTVDVAGGKMPTDTTFDSKSMLPILFGKTDKPNHETLFWQQTKEGWALRHKNWKLISPKEKAKAGKLELYDLATDVSETTDLADKHPDIVKKLHALYKEWHSKNDPKASVRM